MKLAIRILLSSISRQSRSLSIPARRFLLDSPRASIPAQSTLLFRSRITTTLKMSTMLDEVVAAPKAEPKQLEIYPPPTVYQMKTLDKEAFRKKVSLPYIRISVENFAVVNKELKSLYLKLLSFKTIEVEDDQTRQICLHPDRLDAEAIAKVESMAQYLQASDDGKLINFKSYELVYDNFGYHDIFRAILPEDSESISGFSTIGHIIHLNLRDEMLPYKHLIGQVLLDKVKHCRLVVNKINIIDTQFRYFQMETLAEAPGDDGKPMGTIVNTTEAGIRFRFDFAKVYWNPRLSAERTRINNILNKNVDVLYDAFAGVGPFAITAAKFNKCRVVANDLNPESYRWLVENVGLNHVESMVSCHNLDAREFMKTIMRQDLIESVKNFNGSDLNRKYHVVMNLPDMAPQFLDAFDSLLAGVEAGEDGYRIPGLEVHCYTFVKSIEEDEQKDHVLKVCEEYLGHPIDREKDVREIFNVRKVAPKKEMYRLSFHLRQAILYGETEKDDRDGPVESKKLKTE